MGELLQVQEVIFAKGAPSPSADVADLLPYASPHKPDVLTLCDEGIILLQFHVDAPQPNPLLFGLVEDYDPIRIRAEPHPRGGYVLRLIRTNEENRFTASLLHVRSIVESIREVLFYERVRPAIKTMLAQLRVLEHAYSQFVQDRLSASLCAGESDPECTVVQAWIKFMISTSESYTRLFVRVHFPYIENKPLHLALPLDDLLVLINRTIQDNDPNVVFNLIDGPDKEVGRWKDILSRPNLRKEAVMCDANGQLLQTSECGPDVPVILAQPALANLARDYAIEIFTGTSAPIENMFCRNLGGKAVVPLALHIKWPFFSGWAIDHPGGALTAPLDPYAIREEGTAVIGAPRIVGEEPLSYFLSDPLTAYSLDYQRRALDVVATSISRLLRFTSDMVKDAIREDPSLVLRLHPEIKRLTNLDDQNFEEATGDMRDPHYLIKLLRYELPLFARSMHLKSADRDIPTLGRRKIEELQDAVNVMYAMRNNMAHGRHMHKFVALSLRSNDRVSTVLRCAELIVAWICHIFSAESCEFVMPLLSTEVQRVVSDIPLLKRRRTIDCLHAIKSIQRSYFGSRIISARQRKIGKLMNRKQLLQAAQAVTAMLSEKFEATAAVFDENKKQDAPPDDTALDVLQTAQTFLMCFVPRLFPAVGVDDDVPEYKLSRNSDDFVDALLNSKPLTWGALSTTRASFAASNSNSRRRRVSINADAASDISSGTSPKPVADAGLDASIHPFAKPGAMAETVVQIGEAWDRANRSSDKRNNRKQRSVRQPAARNARKPQPRTDEAQPEANSEIADIEPFQEAPRRAKRQLTRRQRRRKANRGDASRQAQAQGSENKEDERSEHNENTNDDQPSANAPLPSKRQRRKAKIERTTARRAEQQEAADPKDVVGETNEQKVEAIVRAMERATSADVRAVGESSDDQRELVEEEASTTRSHGRQRSPHQQQRRGQSRTRRFWRAKTSSVSESPSP